jgi:hypothetical protein
MRINESAIKMSTQLNIVREISIDAAGASIGESNCQKLYQAKIAHADRPTLNGRIYPREVLQSNIDRLKPLLSQGRLTGAVDHMDKLASGNLKDTAVIWRSLEMQPDGAVSGKFEIVDGHSKGKDLKALLDAGAAVGISTLGYGTSHAPSPTELAQYGFPAGSNVVVMDANYTLHKADCVDDPSCADAWVQRERLELQVVSVSNTAQAVIDRWAADPDAPDETPVEEAARLSAAIKRLEAYRPETDDEFLAELDEEGASSAANLAKAGASLETWVTSRAAEAA